jgi:uncharacterized protein YcnI
MRQLGVDRVIGRALRRCMVSGLVLGLVVVSASSAWAVVTIDPDRATQGEPSADVSFRVSNIEPVSTTRFQVVFPSRPVFASVFARSVPGWTTTVVTRHLAKPIRTDSGDVSDAVSEISWTADAAESAVKTDTFERFDVLIGPLPYTTQIVFKAVETFANGDVVRWTQTKTPDDPQPGVPAPVLQLTPPTAPVTPGSLSGAEADANARLQSQLDSARTIGVLGLVVGTLGLIVGGVAIVSRRRRT